MAPVLDPTGRDHLPDMIMQESLPCLVRRAAQSAQDARDSALGDGDAEHLEFAVNPGCAPQRICSSHLLDQSAEFCGGARATSTSDLPVGQPGPESPNPFALPADDRLWLHVH